MSFRINRHEPLADGFHRLLREQIGCAIRDLSQFPPDSRARVVHGVRRRVKKIRAILRLLRAAASRMEIRKRTASHCAMPRGNSLQCGTRTSESRHSRNCASAPGSSAPDFQRRSSGLSGNSAGHRHRPPNRCAGPPGGSKSCVQKSGNDGATTSSGATFGAGCDGFTKRRARHFKKPQTTFR